MSPLPDTEFRDLLDFAHHLADRSGTTILPYFRGQIGVDNKSGQGGFDPVTAADRAAEEVIRDAITTTYPGHAIVGEEFDDHNAGARMRWVIDPIDGTRAFIVGLPTWGTLIGLLDGARPLLGIMDQPFIAERFWCDETQAYWRRASAEPAPLRTRACARIEDAYLSTTHPDLFTPGFEQEAFTQIKDRSRMSRYGADCYAYCLLSAGLIDLVVESGLKPHDVVALIPIIERAGGRITTWDGGDPTMGGRIVASGDPRLHEAALRALST